VNAEDEAKWITAQKKTFTKWFNNHLRKKGYPPITEIKTGFETGITLMQIVNALYDKPMPKKYNKDPKMRPHKLDNLNLAMEMLTNQAEVKTNFLKNTHLLDGDEKMILGMMWAIILHYAINGISVDEMTAKEGLLLWVQKKTKNYSGVDPPGVKDFSKSWRSGLAFCALIHKHHPDRLDYHSLDQKDAAGNLKLAFDVAESLGIPRLLEVEDVNQDKPDERSIMTYVSEFFHAFANANQAEAAIRRCKKFLDFARKMWDAQNEYETRAQALLDWIGLQDQKFSHFDAGETLEDAKECLSFFRRYVVADKPPKLGEFFDVCALLAEIQTDLKVNHRPAYVPPQGLLPADLDAAFANLNIIEVDYTNQARAHRFTFVHAVDSGLSEDQKAEYKASFNHFDANKNGILSATEFKAALVAVNVSFRDENEFKALFNSLSTGGAMNAGVGLDAYMSYMYNRNADKDDAGQVKDSFATLSGGNNNSISDSQLAHFSADEQQFIRNRAPQNADGTYNFASFVDSNYA
jgi:Ca2+-binding EF-hand superfamily protein